MISNLRHQKSVKKLKKRKKVKVKAFFFSRWSNRRRLPSFLDRRSQLSRVRHWLIMNRDLEGSFVFLWQFLQGYLYFKNIRKQAKKEGKKSLEDLAALVSPVIHKARSQTSKEWSPMISKLQLFEPETVFDIQSKENWLASSNFFLWRKQSRMLGKKESKSDGELHRKHWFCIRGNISAGQHALSTPGPLIRHKVYCFSHTLVSNIFNPKSKEFCKLLWCSQDASSSAWLRSNYNQQCRVDWTCTQTKDSTCKLQMQRKHWKISSKFFPRSSYSPFALSWLPVWTLFQCRPLSLHWHLYCMLWKRSSFPEKTVAPDCPQDQPWLNLRSSHFCSKYGSEE